MPKFSRFGYVNLLRHLFSVRTVSGLFVWIACLLQLVLLLLVSVVLLPLARPDIGARLDYFREIRQLGGSLAGGREEVDLRTRKELPEEFNPAAIAGHVAGISVLEKLTSVPKQVTTASIVTMDTWKKIGLVFCLMLSMFMMWLFSFALAVMQIWSALLFRCLAGDCSPSSCLDSLRRSTVHASSPILWLLKTSTQGASDWLEVCVV